MSTIVTRYGKGSPLTWLEVDNNFTNLNTDKIQSGDTVAALTITSATINGGSINGTTIGGSTPAAITGTSGTFTSLSDSGNLTFTGTGNRIRGDFSNATIANQVLFQSSTTNGATQLRAIPNGTGTQTGFFFYDSSDTVNNAWGAIRTVAGLDVRLQSAISGTGTYLPMTFYTGGSERMRIDTSGNVGIGTSNPNTRLTVVGSDSSVELYHNTPSIRFASTPNRTNSWYIGANISDAVNGGFHIGTGANINGGTPRVVIDFAGNVGIGTSSPTQALTVNGAVGYNSPVTVTDATHTVATTTNWIIANRAGTVTLTLPTASSFTGRILTVKNVQAQTVVSASSNVVPIGSTTAGTAILTNTAGKFATLVSDGTNWIIMQAN